MGLTGQAVTALAGTENLLRFGVRFTAQVSPVDTLTVRATVAAITDGTTVLPQSPLSTVNAEGKERCPGTRMRGSRLPHDLSLLGRSDFQQPPRPGSPARCARACRAPRRLPPRTGREELSAGRLGAQPSWSAGPRTRAARGGAWRLDWAAFDELLGHVPCCTASSRSPASSTVTYVRPVPVGRPLHARAWLGRHDGYVVRAARWSREHRRGPRARGSGDGGARLRPTSPATRSWLAQQDAAAQPATSAAAPPAGRAPRPARAPASVGRQALQRPRRARSPRPNEQPPCDDVRARLAARPRASRSAMKTSVARSSSSRLKTTRSPPHPRRARPAANPSSPASCPVILRTAC